MQVDLSQRFPAFSLLLSPESRFRRRLRISWAFLLCALSTLCSMVLLTNAALAVYWHVWKTLEFVGPSLSIVLPISLLVSSLAGSFVGAQMGLSRPVRLVAAIGGLLLFCSDVPEWWLPEWALGLLSGGFEPMLAQEHVARAGYGESMAYVATWGSLSAWAVVGLGIGILFRMPEKLRLVRMVTLTMGFLAVGGLLLGTIYYPLVATEKQQMEYNAERMSSAVKRTHDLKRLGLAPDKPSH